MGRYSCLQEDRAHEVTHGEEPVEDAVGGAEPRVLGDECGVHALEHDGPTVGVLLDGEGERGGAAW